MIYLSGHVGRYRHPNMGFILTPRMRHRIPAGVLLAADNGCYSEPEYYSDERYLKFLRKMPRERTLFATAPDAPYDHQATLRLSRGLLGPIRALGHRAAFVAQDGWDEATTPWDEFDCLFVGGSTEFKFRGGAAAVAAAKRRGKTSHMGRVNSLDRLRAAVSIGCDSVDGTFLRFGPKRRWPELKGWFDHLHRRPEFWPLEK